MKRLVFLGIVLIAILVYATTMQKTWQERHTFTLANIGATVKDSTIEYFRIHEQGSDPYLYLYRVGRLTDIDTQLTNDTVWFVWHVGLEKYNPREANWTLFDTTKIALPGASTDTTVNFGARVDVDSTATAAAANWIRLKMFYKFSVGTTAADSALIGRTKGLKVQAWLNARY